MLSAWDVCDDAALRDLRHGTHRGPARNGGHGEDLSDDSALKRLLDRIAAAVDKSDHISLVRK